jgi:hypothetical protein
MRPTKSALTSVLEESERSKGIVEGQKHSDDEWETADPGDLHSTLGKLLEAESGKEVHTCSIRENEESNAESEFPTDEKSRAGNEAPEDSLQVGRKSTSPMPALSPKRNEFVPYSI